MPSGDGVGSGLTPKLRGTRMPALPACRRVGVRAPGIWAAAPAGLVAPPPRGNAIRRIHLMPSGAATFACRAKTDLGGRVWRQGMTLFGRGGGKQRDA